MSIPISVIILTYNRAGIIKEAIQSVLSQTYSDFELLIIDDGSTDNTQEIIKSYDSPKIRYIYKEHTNIPDSRNFGIKHAQGEYLVWVDSDDILEPQALELLAGASKEDPLVDIVYTDHCLIDSSGKVKHRFYYKDSPNGRMLISAAVKWTPILQCGTLIRKSIYEEVGCYDTFFTKSEDHEFWIRCLKRYKFKHIGLPLYKRRIHAGNISKVKGGSEGFKAEILRRMFKRFSLEEMFPKKMKVAYVLGRFPTITETFIINEIIELVRNGIEIEIFSLDFPKEDIIHSEVVSNRLLERTFYFRYRNILKLRSKNGFISKLIKLTGHNFRTRCKIAYFAQLAEERKIGHVHSHFVHKFGELISRLSKKSYSFTAHCFEEKAMSKEAKQNLRRLIEYSSFVITVTDFARRGLSSMVDPKHRAKIQTIRCGINMEKFSRYLKNEDIFTIVSVAGLYPRKGTHYLIEALALLKGKIKLKTLIIGDGPERHKLEELAQQRKVNDLIQFVGKTLSHEVNRYLRISDCFVLPCIVTDDGYMDGLPVSLMEAMAAGLPVISTPVAGIPELVINGETGLLVPQRDSEALAEAILALYNNPELCEKLGKCARQKVVEEFNLEKTGKQVAELFTHG